MAKDRPGVWFFSLDAANPVVVRIARQLYRLPYYQARMTITPEPDGDRIVYTSVRIDDGAPPAAFRARYGPKGPTFSAAPDSLESWLVERYCLYTVGPDSGVFRAEIDHARWELQPAVAEIEENTMAAAAGITLPDEPPLLHFAKRQEVVAWALKPMEP